MRTESVYLEDDLLLPHVRIAETFLERMRGLMFSPELPLDEGMLLLNCNSVHMFFMNYPLGLIYLSENLAVTRVMPMLRRRQVSMDRASTHVIEVNPALLQQRLITPGMRIRITAPV